jgi:geranylgeranyl diphosphate synthase type I
VDDLLGIWGQEYQTGKPASADITTRKKTLPIVYALGDPDLRSLYSQEILTETDVAQVLAVLGRQDARQFTEEVANAHSAQAMEYLGQVGQETPGRRALSEFAQSLLTRTS